MNGQTVKEATSSIMSSIGNTVTDVFTSAANDAMNGAFQHEISYIQILISLTAAAILGTLIAYHPRRHVEGTGPVTDRELRNSQILICVAGAIMVILIQDSLARAFGLVGLGSFVRYRTALRNPFDLAIIFILIGLGMSCGLGMNDISMYELAITVTSFVYILLYIMSFNKSAYHHTWQLRIDSTDPLIIEKAFRKVAEKQGFLVMKLRRSREAGHFRCLFIAKRSFNTDEVTQDIKDLCGEKIIFSRFDWQLERK